MSCPPTLRPSRSSTANGLLSGVAKLLRPKVVARYGGRLEQLRARAGRRPGRRAATLRLQAADRPVVETSARATRALLGSVGIDPNSDVHSLTWAGTRCRR